MYDLLKEFKDEVGNCDVNTTETTGKWAEHGLGVWVKNQRSTFRRGALKPKRAKALEALGFRWNLNKPRKAANANASPIPQSTMGPNQQQPTINSTNYPDVCIRLPKKCKNAQAVAENNDGAVDLTKESLKRQALGSPEQQPQPRRAKITDSVLTETTNSVDQQSLVFDFPGHLFGDTTGEQQQQHRSDTMGGKWTQELTYQLNTAASITGMSASAVGTTAATDLRTKKNKRLEYKAENVASNRRSSSDLPEDQQVEQVDQWHTDAYKEKFESRLSGSWNFSRKS